MPVIFYAFEAVCPAWKKKNCPILKIRGLILTVNLSSSNMKLGFLKVSWAPNDCILSRLFAIREHDNREKMLGSMLQLWVTKDALKTSFWGS